MSKLKIISCAQMCALLEREGFFATRQSGSHRFYRHIDGRTSLVAIHSADLTRSVIRKILKDIGMSASEYERKV